MRNEISGTKREVGSGLKRGKWQRFKGYIRRARREVHAKRNKRNRKGSGIRAEKEEMATIQGIHGKEGNACMCVVEGRKG